MAGHACRVCLWRRVHHLPQGSLFLDKYILLLFFTDLFFGAESMPRIYTHVMYILVCVHVLHNKKSQKSVT